uniref:uromodulin-like isoform X2 n=1 Tax=Ciona intestinalis TaxID=7719 RepID=UPI000180B659|nr:uromodulin-like isoform X2 [Ciona intestinalis]|eukprot:XP_002130186.1 uromodulin-like isoform X2 [Ciona intestinalis]
MRVKLYLLLISACFWCGVYSQSGSSQPCPTTCPTYSKCSTNGTCECESGFLSMSGKCVADILLECKSHEITIQIQEDVFKTAKFNVDTAVVGGNTSCTATVQGDNIIFKFANDDCSTTVLRNDTHTSYSNFIQTSATIEDKITYGSRGRIPFTCVFPHTSNISVAYNATLSMNPLPDVAPVTGKFDIDFQLVKNDYNTVQGRRIFLTNETLYFKASLNNADTDQLLVFDRCWGSPFVDGSDNYDLIDGGCPKDAVGNSVKINSNGVASDSSFSVKAFKFLESGPQVYLFCTITVCHNNSETCKPSCNSRKKRQSEGNGLSDKSKTSEPPVQMMIGPMMFKEPYVFTDQSPSGLSQPSLLLDPFIMGLIATLAAIIFITCLIVLILVCVRRRRRQKEKENASDMVEGVYCKTKGIFNSAYLE